MIPLTNKEIESKKKKKKKKKKIEDKYADDKKYHWFRDFCYYTSKYSVTAHSIGNISNRIPKEFSVAFHNGSNYDYHFVMTELGKKYKEEFSCLGEKMEIKT